MEPGTTSGNFIDFLQRSANMSDLFTPEEQRAMARADREIIRKRIRRAKLHYDYIEDVEVLVDRDDDGKVRNISLENKTEGHQAGHHYQVNGPSNLVLGFADSRMINSAMDQMKKDAGTQDLRFEYLLKGIPAMTEAARREDLKANPEIAENPERAAKYLEQGPSAFKYVPPTAEEVRQLRERQAQTKKEQERLAPSGAIQKGGNPGRFFANDRSISLAKRILA